MPSKKSSKEKLNRPPVVAVLGHIDHGKTTLLDKIRQTNLAAREAAGITQHIGAYQVTFQGETITFIDTPGHAAFSEMRSRGAEVADLVILVVAADEGFKPQTKESLAHIKEAKVPYLVAINKVDLPHISVDKVKEDLAKNGILVEGHGGDIVSVAVSAKTGKGIKDLLEMILLLAAMADLKGKPENKLKAVVIESKLDRNRGPVATVLVRDGSLRVGDEVKVENVGAKIRAMFDERGQKVTLLGPGKAVGILGFKAVPAIGGQLIRGRAEETEEEKPVSKTDEKEKAGPKIILKTDVAGTLEAIQASLPKEVEVVASGVGDVGESDILLAETVGAEVIGFGVKVPKGVAKLAQVDKVEVNTYQVIYDLLEAVEEKLIKKTTPTVSQEVLGEAEIIAEFEVKGERVAGCRVRQGKIGKKDKLRLRRGKEVISDCRIKSMKKGKEDISQVEKGEEFGVILDPALDFKIGDVLVSSHSVGK